MRNTIDTHPSWKGASSVKVRRMEALVALAVVLACAVALAGCASGGTGSESGTGATPPASVPATANPGSGSGLPGNGQGTASGTGAADPDSQIQVGKLVAAPRAKQKGLYMALAVSLDGDQLTVMYASDGSKNVIPASTVTRIPEKDWVAGDKVMAPNLATRYERGVVTERLDTDYLIKWDDGGAPSTAAGGSLMPR